MQSNYSSVGSSSENQGTQPQLGHYLITLTIPDIKCDQSVTMEQVTCYVYLGEKIQDVRGINLEETRIKIPSFQDINHDLLMLNIQVKVSPTQILGYFSLSLLELLKHPQKQVERWFVLSNSKDDSASSLKNDIQGIAAANRSESQDKKTPRIFINIALKQISPSKYNNNANPYSSTSNSQIIQNQSSTPTKASPAKLYVDKNQFQVSPIYQIDLDNSSLQQYEGEPIKSNRSDHSQNIFNLDDKSSVYTVKSRNSSPYQLQSQVYIKKKKNFTKSANPTIGMMNSPHKQATFSNPGHLIIDDALLATLQPEIDHNVVKNSLLEDINKGMSDLHETADKGLSDTKTAYNQVKQISQTDQQDLVKYSDRDQLVSRIAKVTQMVVSKKQGQNLNKQQIEQQLEQKANNKEIPQKRDQLQQLQAENDKLRVDLHSQNGGSSDPYLRNNNSGSPGSAQGQQLIAEQIVQSKEELIGILHQIKQDLANKSLSNKIVEETDTIYNQSMLEKQQEQNGQLDELAKARLDSALFIQKLEQENQEALGATKRADMQVDRKKIELMLLNKRIVSATNEIKQTDKLYTDIINKLKSKRKGQAQHSDQLKQKISDLEVEFVQNQEALTIQQQRLNENEFERTNDPQVISNKDVLASYNKLQENLTQFLNQIETRQENVQELNDIWQVLKSELGQTQIEQLFALVGIQDKLAEKNQQLANKVQLINELAQSYDNQGADVEVATSQKQIEEIFNKAYTTLLNKEKELKEEYQRIKAAATEIVKIREEIEEKLNFQDKDFEDFAHESQRQQYEVKSLEEQQALINRQLLQVKSKAELEGELLERMTSIRELEAILRGKDHEIDTLELIQSQKDSIILELEEQAGRFKEVVKEVRYESTKNDRVEEELFRYMESHPLRVLIKKLGDGYYKFGTRRIYLKLDSDDETLMVRIAPKEYTTLNAFIIENEGGELAKVNVGKALLTRLKL